MPVVSQDVLTTLLAEYATGSSLWRTYPEFDEADQQRILTLGALDRPIVRQVCFRDAIELPPGRPGIYLATAGAPAAGKSTLLDCELEANPRYRGMVRIDPDLYSMRAMVHTYHDYLCAPRMLIRSEDFALVQQRAYDVARLRKQFR